MKIKNEQLAQDVDSKNRELAVSTMSLIKKDELLALIKEDLKNAPEITNKSVKSVITTITKNINKEDSNLAISWNLFFCVIPFIILSSHLRYYRITETC